MITAGDSTAAPSPRPRSSHAAVNYRPRIVGSALFGAMLLSLPSEERSAAHYFVIVAGGLIWPQVAFWHAARPAAPKHAERTNVLLDAVFGGAAATALALRLWPVTAICLVGFINCLLFGGPRFLAVAFGLFIAGALAALPVFGLNVHLDSEPITTAISIATIFAYVVLIGTTAYRVRLRQRATRAALEQEERKSQGLLTNVFPSSIVPRLRAGENPIADQFADATVIFVDIVAFTPLAERLGPKRTVLLLNDLFAKFDHAAARLGIEKIETTGDGYLAVGGAPQVLDHHPEAAADFALAVLEAARTTVVADGPPVEVRAGIHTGPVFAGVIGESRFHYKIFGETVNLASRVQAEARPNTALVSETTYKRIQHSHAVEEYATLELKGHGPMRLFWLGSRGKRRSLENAA